MKEKITKLIQKIYFPYLYSIFWTIIILYLSLGKMPENNTIKINIPHLDKIVHFLMYFIYTSLLLIERKRQKKSTIVLIVPYSIIFGMLMELLQAFIFTYRSGDYYDILFNTLGVFSSLLFWKKFLFIRP